MTKQGLMPKYKDGFILLSLLTKRLQQDGLLLPLV